MFLSDLLCLGDVDEILPSDPLFFNIEESPQSSQLYKHDIMEILRQAGRVEDIPSNFNSKIHFEKYIININGGKVSLKEILLVGYQFFFN